MPFKKGQVAGRNGGRKTKVEEVQAVLDSFKEEITQEALIKLANSKVYKFLNDATKHSEVKDLGLPITLKAMTDKKEISVLNMTQLLKSLKDE